MKHRHFKNISSTIRFQVLVGTKVAVRLDPPDPHQTGSGGGSSTTSSSSATSDLYVEAMVYEVGPTAPVQFLVKLLHNEESRRRTTAAMAAAAGEEAAAAEEREKDSKRWVKRAQVREEKEDDLV